MPIRITAAICTHNRDEVLGEAIESLLNQTLPPDQYEVLVVDNNSSDATAGLVANFSPGRNLTYLFEPRQGLSYARNTAVRAAAGEIIAFLDDDAIASPQWLAALLEAYAAYPDAWAVGGKVEPQWAGQRPDWLTDKLLPQLSMRDLGSQTAPLSPHQTLFGVNCSFRRSIFATIGLFRTDLGRDGGLLMGSEEVELQKRIWACNKLIIYTPAALVWHRVPAERLCRRYFVRLAYYKGISQARLIPTQTVHLEILWPIARKGVGLIWHWLLLAPQPLDQSKQLHCLRLTAHWLGFVQEGIALIGRQKLRGPIAPLTRKKPQ